jgi:hypothetical protein
METSFDRRPCAHGFIVPVIVQADCIHEAVMEQGHSITVYGPRQGLNQATQGPLKVIHWA